MWLVLVLLIFCGYLMNIIISFRGCYYCYRYHGQSKAGVAEGSKCGSIVTCSGSSIPSVSERASGWPKVELWEDVNICSWFDLLGISTINTCIIASIILYAMHVKRLSIWWAKKPRGRHHRQSCFFITFICACFFLGWCFVLLVRIIGRFTFFMFASTTNFGTRLLALPFFVCLFLY